MRFCGLSLHWLSHGLADIHRLWEGGTFQTASSGFSQPPVDQVDRAADDALGDMHRLLCRRCAIPASQAMLVIRGIVAPLLFFESVLLSARRPIYCVPDS